MRIALLNALLGERRYLLLLDATLDRQPRMYPPTPHRPGAWLSDLEVAPC
jgi:hypothetical protein